MHELFSCDSERAFLDGFKKMLIPEFPITEMDLWLKDIPFSGYRSVGNPSAYRHELDENQSEQLISQVILLEDHSANYWVNDNDSIKKPCIAALGARTGQLLGWFVIDLKNPEHLQEAQDKLLDAVVLAGYAYERMLLLSIIRMLTNHTLTIPQDHHIDLLTAISSYVSQFSHQLKNPMTSIRGYSDLITNGFLGQITEQQAQSLETIIYNLDRVNEGVLIPNSIFKLYANRLEKQKQNEDIREILCRVADQFQRIKQRTQVRMVYDLPEMLEFPTDAHYFEESIRGMIKACMHFMEVDQDCKIKSFICADELFIVLQCRMDFMRKINVIDDFDQMMSQILLEGNYHEIYALWRKSILLWKYIGGEIVKAEMHNQTLRLTLRLPA
jgi:signal transduction histidine kinase